MALVRALVRYGIGPNRGGCQCGSHGAAAWRRFARRRSCQKSRANGLPHAGTIAGLRFPLTGLRCRMLLFEWTLVLLLAAVLLAALARRFEMPYPALLALAGAVLAFL